MFRTTKADKIFKDYSSTMLDNLKTKLFWTSEVILLHTNQIYGAKEKGLASKPP